MTLKLSKEDAPMGYSFIGFFETRPEVDAWYNSAIKAGKKYPFYLTMYGEGVEKRFVLFWKKPKNAKKCGKGFK